MKLYFYYYRSNIHYDVCCVYTKKNGDLHRISKLWFNLKISRQQYTLHEHIVDLFVVSIVLFIGTSKIVPRLFFHSYQPKICIVAKLRFSTLTCK